MPFEGVQLAGRDLVAPDGVWLGMKGAHVLDKAARDGGRQFDRLWTDRHSLDTGEPGAEFSPRLLPLSRARLTSPRR